MLPEIFKKEVILCPEAEEVPAAVAPEVVLEVPAADSEVPVLMVDSEARAVRPRPAEAGDGAIAAEAAACPAA